MKADLRTGDPLEQSWQGAAKSRATTIHIGCRLRDRGQSGCSRASVSIRGSRLRRRLQIRRRRFLGMCTPLSPHRARWPTGWRLPFASKSLDFARRLRPLRQVPHPGRRRPSKDQHNMETALREVGVPDAASRPLLACVDLFFKRHQFFYDLCERRRFAEDHDGHLPIVLPQRLDS